ncbi:unnamed protein product [Cunninghamella echinulata]
MWHISIQTNNCSEYRVHAVGCHGIDDTWIRVYNDTLHYYNAEDKSCKIHNGSVSLDSNKCNIFNSFALSYDTNDTSSLNPSDIFFGDAVSTISHGYLFIVLISLLLLGQKYLLKND